MRLLDAIEESLRQLAAMEGGRAVSTARVEAGSLARAPQDERDSHIQEARSLETQVKHCPAEEAKRSMQRCSERDDGCPRASRDAEREGGEGSGGAGRKAGEDGGGDVSSSNGGQPSGS